MPKPKKEKLRTKRQLISDYEELEYEYDMIENDMRYIADELMDRFWIDIDNR